MMKCDLCGAEYSKRDIKFCVKCGNQLYQSVEQMSCLRCNNTIKVQQTCPICGKNYSETDQLIIQQMDKLDQRMGQMENRLDETNTHLQEITELLKTSDITKEDLDDLYEVEIPPQPSTEPSADISTTKMKPETPEETETPRKMEKVEKTAEPSEEVAEEKKEGEKLEEHVTVEQQAQQEPQEPQVEPELQKEEAEDELPISPPTEPSYTQPQVFDLDIAYEPEPEPVKLPTMGSPSTKVKKVDWKTRLLNLVEGPLLVSAGIFTLIMALLSFAIVQDWPPLTQGGVFTGIGFLTIITGYGIATGKAPILPHERGLGIFAINTGYVLSLFFGLMGITSDIAFAKFILLQPIIVTILTGWIALQLRSKTVSSVVTGTTIFIPIFLIQTSFELTSILGGLFSFGGGIVWLLPLTYFVYKITHREISTLPSLILFLGGPTIGIAITNFTTQGLLTYNFTVLGIVASLFPISFLITIGRIEYWDNYMKWLLGTIFVWPVVAHLIQKSNLGNNYMSGIYSLIFLVMYTVSLYFATTTREKGYEILPTVKANITTFRKYTTLTISVVSLIEAIYFVYSIKNQNTIRNSLALTGGIGLGITIVVVYSLSRYESFFLKNAKYQKLAKIASSLGVAFMYFGLGRLSLVNTFPILDWGVVIMTLSILIVGGIISQFDQYFVESDNILTEYSILVLTISLIISYYLSPITRVNLILANLAIFILVIILPSISKKKRLKLNNIALLGNTIVISLLSFVELSGAISLFGEDYSAVSIILAFALIAGFSSLVLHYVHIRTKLEFEFDQTQETLSDIWKRFEKITLNNQEVVLSSSISIIFILFSIRDVFGSWSNDPQIITLAILTPILLATIFIARRGNWITIIPGLLTIISAAYKADTDVFTGLLLAILSSYVIIATIINYLDQKNEGSGNSQRIISRELVLWGTLYLAFIQTEGIQLVILAIGIGVLILSSLTNDIFRRKSPWTGIGLLVGGIIVTYLPYRTDLPLFLGIISISIVIIFNFIQYSYIGIDYDYELPKGIEKTRQFLSVDKEGIAHFYKVLGPVIATLSLDFGELGYEPTTNIWVLGVVIALVLMVALFAIDSRTLLPVMLLLSGSFEFVKYVNTTWYWGLSITAIYLIPVFYTFITMELKPLWQISGGLLIAVGSITLFHLLTDPISIFVTTVGIGLGLGINLIKTIQVAHAHSPFGLFAIIVAFLVDYGEFELFGFIPQFFQFDWINLLLFALVGGVQLFLQEETKDNFAEGWLSIGLFALLSQYVNEFYGTDPWIQVVIGFIAAFSIISIEVKQRFKVSWYFSAIMLLALFSFWGELLVIQAMAVILVVQQILEIYNQDIEMNNFSNSIRRYTPMFFGILLLIDVGSSTILTVYAMIYGILILLNSSTEQLNEIWINRISLLTLLLGLFVSQQIGSSIPEYSQIITIPYVIASYVIIAGFAIYLAFQEENNLFLDFLNLIGVNFLLAAHYLVEFRLSPLVIAGQEWIIYVIQVITQLAISYYLWKSKKISDHIIASIALMFAFVVSGTGGALMSVVVALNLIFAFIASFANTRELYISQLLGIGIGYLVLGITAPELSSDINTTLIDIYNQSWYLLYALWQITVLMVALQGKFSITTDRFEVSFEKLVDIIPITWLVHLIFIVGWSGLTYNHNLLFIGMFMALGYLIVIILRDEIRIDQHQRHREFLLYGVLVAFSLISGFFYKGTLNVFSINSDIDLIHIHNLFVLFPMALTTLIYTNRGYQGVDPDTISSGGMMGIFVGLVLAASLHLDRYLGTQQYLFGFIPVIPTLYLPLGIIAWAILLLAAWTNNSLASTSYIVFIYACGLILGFQTGFDYADAQFSGSILVTIGIAVITVLYLFRAEFENRFYQGHHPVLLVSILALLVATFQIDNRVIGSSTSIATTIVTINFAAVGAMVYMYGTKFRRDKYRYLAIILILLNLFRGLLLYLSRLFGFQETKQGDPLISFISFLWASLMIFFVVGVNKLSQREDLNKYLAILFKPIDREENGSRSETK